MTQLNLPLNTPNLTATRKKELHCKTKFDLARVLPVYLVENLSKFLPIDIIGVDGKYYHNNTRGKKWELISDTDTKVLLEYCNITAKETK